MYFSKLDLAFDQAALSEALGQVKSLVDVRGQVAVNSPIGDDDPLYGYMKKRQPIEALCPVVNEPFRGTYFETVIKRISGQLGRARIMRLLPRTCYSYHQDTSYRFHLALETNPHCLFYCEGHIPFHIPRDGHVYRVNTMLRHTALNAGGAERYHLVMVDLAGQQLAHGML